MQVNASYIKAFTIAVIAHLVLIAIIAMHYQKGRNQLPPQSVKPVINSYIYHRPKPEKPQEPQPTPTKEATTEIEIEPPKEITTSKLAPKVVKIDEPQINKPPKKRAISAQKPFSKQASSKKSSRFNPYQGLSKVIQQQEQQWLEEEVQRARAQRGLSAMQTAPAPVPQRKQALTNEEKRRQNTSQVGHETITKQNGVCQQVSDLSFIDDNLGKVTSYSACGETEDEKYFREFMQKRMAEYKK